VSMEFAATKRIASQTLQLTILMSAFARANTVSIIRNATTHMEEEKSLATASTIIAVLSRNAPLLCLLSLRDAKV
jgi:hypothetical protein